MEKKLVYFNRFYIDKEKDIVVELYKTGEADELTYIIRTPNHKSGNLISNLAKRCNMDFTRDENGFKFKPLGEGKQDFPSIIESAKEIGVEYLIVEQDGHPDYEPLESVRRSREYLRTLGLW